MEKSYEIRGGLEILKFFAKKSCIPAFLCYNEVKKKISYRPVEGHRTLALSQREAMGTVVRWRSGEARAGHGGRRCKRSMEKPLRETLRQKDGENGWGDFPFPLVSKERSIGFAPFVFDPAQQA
jgi:hypothetical protein